MDTRIDQIAPAIHRISTYIPEGPPGGITHNQFLVAGKEPLLFHTGIRRAFPSVRDAVASVIDPATIRWISSCHASFPDEYGAVEDWFQLAPNARVMHGQTGCFLALFDLLSRPPRPLADGEVVDLGGPRVRWIATPHVPNAWESGAMFEEVTETLLCGDLFARTGGTTVTTTEDIYPEAIAHEDKMHGHAITARLAPTLRALAALRPKRIAPMHAPTFVGDGAHQLEALADHFEIAARESMLGSLGA